jgi:tetrahydromethanopterin S-methyltransferase subunit G
LLDDVDELKRRLAEVEERLDFTERLLAREREADRLGPPR